MSTAEVSETRKRRVPSNSADVELGVRAHTLIWRAGLKDQEVAEQLGLNPSVFGRKLRGKTRWALQEALDLANALDTTAAYLLGETENPHPVDPDGGNVRPERLELPTLSVKDRALAPVYALTGERVA